MKFTSTTKVLQQMQLTFLSKRKVINVLKKGSDWGSVGRAVTSDTKDPRFESIHKHITIAVNCFEKTKTSQKGNHVTKMARQNNSQL